MRCSNKGCLLTVVLVIFLMPVFVDAAEAAAPIVDGHAWWFWPLILLIVTFISMGQGINLRL